MPTRFSRKLIAQIGWLFIVVFFLSRSVNAQADPELNLKGAIDIHVHQGPDSVDRAIDADDLARLALKMGMRGMVMKNHFEETGSLVYMVRKEVPGIELFGGVTQDLAVGGINLEAVKHMVAMKGGWGRVIWLPTFDAENAVKAANSTAPFVRVTENGKLVPAELELIDYVAKHPDLVLETGHVSGEEGDLVVHEAHQRGVAHIVVTHAMASYVRMTIPQMQAAAADGAFIEFVYGATLGLHPVVTISDYARAIRIIGPKSCILATDFGSVQKPPEPQRPLEPQGFLDFMNALHKEGISVEDINLMAKTNPAIALGLKP
ncbi:MAG TPA: DUF6282 family protein [Candidatus Acidoferrales bacterium]|nr:DUF6282 family protein [Candidatus Acidoferrales bacterium]